MKTCFPPLEDQGYYKSGLCRIIYENYRTGILRKRDPLASHKETLCDRCKKRIEPAQWGMTIIEGEENIKKYFDLCADDLYKIGA